MLKFGKLLLGTCAILLISCDKDTPQVLEPPMPVAQITGEFSMEITHRSWVQTRYDSVGNIVYQGYDTTRFSNELFMIRETNTDTFLLATLLNSLRQTTTNVPAIMISDTLRLIHEYGEPQLRNDYIRGNVWMKEDSLFYDYSWDKSDIWSAGALPERGSVIAKGVRQ